MTARRMKNAFFRSWGWARRRRPRRLGINLSWSGFLPLLINKEGWKPARACRLIGDSSGVRGRLLRNQHNRGFPERRLLSGRIQNRDLAIVLAGRELIQRHAQPQRHG